MTAQSMTCQPHRPWRSVSRTVSSTARKNASGIDPSSTSSRNSTPAPTGAGSTRSPTVARNGFGRSPSISTAVARADESLDADRRRLAELDVDAEVGRQRLLDDLLLHLAVEREEQLLPDVVLPQVDQRILLGELRERDVQRALLAGVERNDGRLQRRRSEVVLRGARDAPIASPILISPRPQTFPISRAPTNRARTAEPLIEDADGGHLALVLADLQTVSHAQRAREHPDVGDPLARLAPLDLEDGARGGPSASPSAAGSSSAMPPISTSTPAPVIAEPKNTGCTSAALRLRRKLRAKPVVRDALVLDVRVEDRLVALGERLGEPVPERGAARGCHRDDRAS